MTTQLLENIIDSKSNLSSIAKKVYNGERLSFDDGVALYKSNDLLSIGIMADHVRRKLHGNKTYFINNYHINPTNLCVGTCSFCAYKKESSDPLAYWMDVDEVVKRSLNAKERGASEIHMVSGLHPDHDLDFYCDVIKKIKEINPTIHMQAFTAVEIDYLADLANLSIEDTLRKLVDAGLGSMPGGGAEIFAPRVRQAICGVKVDANRWLDVHRTAHKLGMKSNSTMLYGHIETIEDRVDHMMKLRELQDETGGFMTFIPLAFHPENTQLNEFFPTTGFDDLKNLAIGRLMLDNIPHIKAFWIQISEKIAQVSLTMGVDDMDGTVVEEKITHSAGARTAQHLAYEKIIHIIRSAGFQPIERDTVYNIIREC